MCRRCDRNTVCLEYVNLSKHRADFYVMKNILNLPSFCSQSYCCESKTVGHTAKLMVKILVENASQRLKKMIVN